jgi:hypothetical protein
MARQKNRFRLLCEAYDKGVRECDEYRTACREFVVDLRGAIVEFFSCPEHKIFLYPPTQGFTYRSHILQGDATDIEFLENGDAVIGFAINASNTVDELENKFFTFLVRFRKTGPKMVFGLYEDESVFEASEEGLGKFCDYFFPITVDTLERRLEFFLQEPEKPLPIGFQVRNRETPGPGRPSED